MVVKLSEITRIFQRDDFLGRQSKVYKTGKQCFELVEELKELELKIYKKSN